MPNEKETPRYHGLANESNGACRGFSNCAAYFTQASIPTRVDVMEFMAWRYQLTVLGLWQGQGLGLAKNAYA